jgi:hypothetical protein
MNLLLYLVLVLELFISVSKCKISYSPFPPTSGPIEYVPAHASTQVDNKNKSSPVTGLEWPRKFQEVKVPRFHDNGTGWW